jgi:hypothetical protein
VEAKHSTIPSTDSHFMLFPPEQTKLERGDYSHPREFKHDLNLVWANCMTYNADGSEYYALAANLKKITEERYAKAIKEDGESNICGCTASCDHARYSSVRRILLSCLPPIPYIFHSYWLR